MTCAGMSDRLMLSFGDQMQCVSLPVVSDDQQSTNHFLAFSGGAVSGECCSTRCHVITAIRWITVPFVSMIMVIILCTILEI